MDNDRRERRIFASGLGRGRSFDADEVARAAAGLVPKGSASFARVRTAPPAEQSLHLGPLRDGPVQGHEISDHWAAIGLAEEPDLLSALKPLVSRRGGRTHCFEAADEIIPFWRRERDRGLRAICIVGQRIPWQTQEALQLDGALVARLPFTDPERLKRYAKLAASRERERSKLRRVAWIITPVLDGFTRALDEVFREPLAQTLSNRWGFSVLHLQEGGIHAGSLETPGFIVLLTHGEDPPNEGAPVGLSAALQGEIQRACEAGAVVAHLGCNGAGMFARGRYSDLPERLGVDDCPRAEHDTFSAFGLDCLERGASAVLAHVDSTWSNAFERAQPVVDWTDWVCSGKGAFGHAADSILEEATRSGNKAYERLTQGREAEANAVWLRHLDLRGFVTLGDPSAYCRWS